MAYRKTIIGMIAIAGLAANGASGQSTTDTIAERGQMGLQAYEKVLDALEVPASERFPLRNGGPNEAVTRRIVSGMERARHAQEKALEGEDRQSGYK